MYGGGGGLVARSCPALGTPWTVAHQAPLSMGFPRQEYWSGLPFSFPGSDPGIEPVSPALAGGFFLTEPPGKAIRLCICHHKVQTEILTHIKESQ